MKILKLSTALMGLALLGFAGCGSSDSTDPNQPGVTSDAGSDEFGLVEGPRCYQITSIAPGFDDKCGLFSGPDGTLVGKSLPGTYTRATGTLTLGTKGSLGGGVITHNSGTLLRSGPTSDKQDPTCTWNQTDTTTITMTATYQFTASVVETESSFAAACGVAPDCTSSWTWTFADDAGAKSPANDCL
jgi:hypothetical protein